MSAAVKGIEDKLIGDLRVKDVGTFIDSGKQRLYLPVDPAFPYAEYAQIIVNTPTFADVNI